MDQLSIRVACVIPTFNRLGTIKKSFDAVTNQTRKPDHVIVVDNHSTDGSAQWLSELQATRNDVITVSLDKNYGGAGGFYHGIKKAYESGADWIWAMDDDCIPNPDALEQLLNCGIITPESHSEQVGFLASQVNWTDGTRHWANFPAPAFDWTVGHERCQASHKIQCATFVSILINRDAIARVGYPVKEFFIWWDDLEFTHRVVDAGFSAYYVEASKVTHLTAANRGCGDYFDIPEQDVWKYKILSRNRVAMAFRRARRYRLVHAVLEMGRIYSQMTKQQTPFGIKASIMVPAIKGLFFNYKKYIIYPESGTM
jgi:GT2 family glycosyltransferase